MDQFHWNQSFKAFVFFFFFVEKSTGNMCIKKNPPLNGNVYKFPKVYFNIFEVN